MLIFFRETQAPIFTSRLRLYLLGKITGLVDGQSAPLLSSVALLQGPSPNGGTPITTLSITLRQAVVDGQFIVMVSKLMNSTYN